MKLNCGKGFKNEGHTIVAMSKSLLHPYRGHKLFISSSGLNYFWLFWQPFNIKLYTHMGLSFASLNQSITVQLSCNFHIVIHICLVHFAWFSHELVWQNDQLEHYTCISEFMLMSEILTSWSQPFHLISNCWCFSYLKQFTNQQSN